MNGPQREGHMASYIERRKLLATLGGAAAWPLAARAQQPVMRTVGYLSPRSSDTDTENNNLAAFRRGLNETGYIEGENLAIVYRWAEGQYDRLTALAAELVGRGVDVIVTTGGPQPVRAARAATQTIPIVFISGSDPVVDGLVETLNRPGRNITGVYVFTAFLGPKRLEFLCELIPKAHVIAFLVNPRNQQTDMQISKVREAARVIGVQVDTLNASTEGEIDSAFATLIQRGADAVLMGADVIFQVRRDQVVALAARYTMPKIGRAHV